MMGGRERMPVAYMMCDEGLEGRWRLLSCKCNDPALYKQIMEPHFLLTQTDPNKGQQSGIRRVSALMGQIERG
ncbi:hypothetical protein OUZ56_001184 [Daphnia magna]|uniref:Uncharacterized protein n=1 Tax=Daphnia magna TaxID=35525 RepID=A0ABR0A1Y8_9CRUS|nr:hypothetical protein OUZ56_001184 [Daphnia magna]